MAKSTIAFSALLLACFALFELGFAEHTPQPAPAYDSSLEQCIKNITEECGFEILRNIVHKGPEITDSCCGAMMKFGRPCHSELILTVLSTGKYASREVEILQKSTAAWKRCRSIVKGH